MSLPIEQLTAFLGWCTLINIGLLLFSTLMIALIKDFAIRVHSKMFDLDPQTLHFNKIMDPINIRVGYLLLLSTNTLTLLIGGPF